MLKTLFKLLLLTLLLLPMNVSADNYIESNRDTRLSNEEMEIVEVDLSTFEKIYETDALEFYFKDERDVIAVYDKETGYTWKSGLDLKYKNDIYDACDEAEADVKNEVCEPVEKRLNTTFTGIANSLVTVEYYDRTNNIKRLSSASYEDVESTLNKIDDTHFELVIDFDDIDLLMKVNIEFTDLGYIISINDEDLSGDGKEILAAVLISPFMGATGGQQEVWNAVEQDYTDVVEKEMVPGYSFVPDGSGALIEYKDHINELESYEGVVYGRDLAFDTYYQSFDDFFVPLKEPSIPVFGMSHGYNQAAFVAYATEGDENLEIISMPEENMTYYNWTYPRFVYNRLFHQIYNKRGDGYFKLAEEPMSLDIEMHYEFLSNEDANYVGMAKNYRNYLMNEGVLDSLTVMPEPTRLDFLMSDIKNGIFNYRNITMTTSDDVIEIVDGFENKIFNINLIGWQKGGETLSKPWKVSLNRNNFSTREFKNLVETLDNHSLSLVQDYLNINSEQMLINGKAVKHINGWYLEKMFFDYPITDFTFAKPVKSIEWLTDQVNDLSKYNLVSHTVSGISSEVMSDYSNDGINRSDAIDLYMDAFETLSNDVAFNMIKPNEYLLEYTHNYLDIPVFSSQHMIESSTVPFIQLVLHNTMGLYAPYANFSFSDQESILRMVDYNVLPSFVVTKEPSYLLIDSMKKNYFSTEIDLYDQLINETYNVFDEIYQKTWDAEWTNRVVLEPGFVMNEYSNGVKVFINYTNNTLSYEGVNVEPLSFSLGGSHE
jgi:hypothetical protein